MSKYSEIFCCILKKYHNADKWAGSLFEEMKRISNTHVGSVGQDFVEQLCIVEGLKYKFPVNVKGDRVKQNPWDIEIENIKFELKTATEDTNTAFQFNHIRYHRKYDAVICLGVSPDSLHFNLWSKADIVTGKAGNLVSMEKGANASYKLTKRVCELKDIAEFAKCIVKLSGAIKKV